VIILENTKNTLKIGKSQSITQKITDKKQTVQPGDAFENTVESQLFFVK
jgi:hypothetical protein